jgi:hypothetical protein
MIFQRMKNTFFLILISLCGTTAGCMGSSGPAAGPGAASGGLASPSDPNAPGGIHEAATPPIGSQTTDQGFGTGGKIVVYVTPPKPEGNENSLATTAIADPSSPLFSGKKPRVYSSQSDESAATDGAGQILIPCIVYKNPIGGESFTELHATYEDSEKSYKSETVPIDCTNIPSSPVPLALNPVRTQRDDR